MERAYQRLKDHRDELELLTAALMEREELDRDDVAKLLGPRPPTAAGASATGPRGPDPDARAAAGSSETGGESS